MSVVADLQTEASLTAVNEKTSQIGGSVIGEPVWEIARLFPYQGQWDEGNYLDLNTNHLVEFSQGLIEVLPVPSYRHQFIAFYLARLLFNFVSQHNLGVVLPAPLKVKLWESKFREPDIVFMFKEKKHKRGEIFWQGADLVMEVVSPDDPKRDTEIKRAEYAKAGISEYWLVNPINETVTVFTLPEGTDVYETHGEFGKDEIATSALLMGFKVKTAEVFAEVE